MWIPARGVEVDLVQGAIILLKDVGIVVVIARQVVKAGPARGRVEVVPAPFHPQLNSTIHQQKNILSYLSHGSPAGSKDAAKYQIAHLNYFHHWKLLKIIATKRRTQRQQ